jgi:hypothetical protein
MKKRGLFDIEDFVWFFVFLILMVMIVIAISFTGCTNKTEYALTLKGNELNYWIAQREMTNYLNARIPNYKLLDEKIDQTLAINSNIFVDGAANLPNVKTYLQQRNLDLENKTYGEFIGIIILDAGWPLNTEIFSVVTKSLFMNDPCITSRDIELYCSDAQKRPKYAFPIIYVGAKDALKSTTYVDVDSPNMLPIRESIPLPDGTKVTVTYYGKNVVFES